MGQVIRSTAVFVLKASLCALAYASGITLAGTLLPVVGMKPPPLPAGVDPKTLGQYLLAASFVLAPGLAPIARRIPGGFWSRWSILAAFTYICYAVNTTIEASIFTRAGGAPAPLLVLFFLPCVLLAGAIVLLFPPKQDGAESGNLAARTSRPFTARRPAEWVQRFLGALLAFPAVYLVFGLAVSPFVKEVYRRQEYGLVLPGLGLILSVQMARSFLFLVASLPILIMYSGSRRRLAIDLGLAYFVLVGLFGLIQNYWMPRSLRAIHGMEILADSIVYAWLLVSLLVPESRKDLERGERCKGMLMPSI